MFIEGLCRGVIGVIQRFRFRHVRFKVITAKNAKNTVLGKSIMSAKWKLEIKVRV